MKPILIFLLMGCIYLQAQGIGYREGWERGWKNGWHRIRGEFYFPPMAPWPSFPAWDRDNFTCGYDDGLLRAISEASR